MNDGPADNDIRPLGGVLAVSLHGAGRDLRSQVTRASITVLADSDHPAASIRTKVRDLRADGHTPEPDALLDIFDTLARHHNTPLGGARPTGDIAGICHSLTTGIDTCNARKLASTAAEAADIGGWRTWLSAVAGNRGHTTIDVRAAVELIRSGVALDTAIDAAAHLADKPPSAP